MKPIIFSTEHIPKILDGSKTMTRRVIKPQPSPEETLEVGLYHPTKIDKNGNQYPGDEVFGAFTPDGEYAWKCPYGQVGDRLWCKETHYRFGYWERFGGRWIFRAVSTEVRYFDDPPNEVLTGFKSIEGWYKRPSIFMFRKDSRITLEITEVRVEKLKGITEGGARSEGINEKSYIDTNGNCISYAHGYYICTFQNLWDSLNAKRGYSWEVNPWLWVISFKRIE